MAKYKKSGGFAAGAVALLVVVALVLIYVGISYFKGTWNPVEWTGRSVQDGEPDIEDPDGPGEDITDPEGPGETDPPAEPREYNGFILSGYRRSTNTNIEATDIERLNDGSYNITFTSTDSSEIGLYLSDFAHYPIFGAEFSSEYVELSSYSVLPGETVNIKCLKAFPENIALVADQSIGEYNYCALSFGYSAPVDHLQTGYLPGSDPDTEALFEIDCNNTVNTLEYPRDYVEEGIADIIAATKSQSSSYDPLTDLYSNENMEAEISFNFENENVAAMFGLSLSDFAFTVIEDEYYYPAQMIIDRLIECGKSCDSVMDTLKQIYDGESYNGFELTFTLTGEQTGEVLTFSTLVRIQVNEEELFSIGGTALTQSGQNFTFSVTDETNYVAYSQAGLSAATISVNADISGDFPTPPSAIAPIFVQYTIDSAFNPKDCYETAIPAIYRGYLPFLLAAQNYYDEGIPLCTITFEDSDITFGILFDVSELIGALTETS